MSRDSILQFWSKLIEGRGKEGRADILIKYVFGLNEGKRWEVRY
jgi:hypothetical protein